MRTPDSLAIFSGGLDSTTLVYHMLEEGYTPHLLSFDYGQRHRKELEFARATAINLDLPHDVVDLTGLTHLINNSALTSPTHNSALFAGEREIEVPEGHYAEDSMKTTVVPNRNMIMISIAGGVAVNAGYKTIGLGVHSGDHFIYPDCRPDFIYRAAQAIYVGNEGLHKFKQIQNFPNTQGGLYTPFIDATKTDIAYEALQLDVPLDSTWSCYKGDKYHCGRCGTCVERLEAINGAITQRNHEIGGPSLFVDATQYMDDEFWKTAVKK